MNDKITTFREISCVILAGITGGLIALPMTATVEPHSQQPLILIIIFTILGGMIGYRRRKSAPFFYLTLLSILVLSTVISFSLFEH